MLTTPNATELAVYATVHLKLAGGGVVCIPHPDLSRVEIDYFALALSRINRGSGNLPGFYSVARHSAIIAKEFLRQGTRDSRRAAAAALLDDAHEAFIGDVPGPVKSLLPDYVRLESLLRQAIFDRFGVSTDPLPLVKQCEKRLQAYEDDLFATQRKPIRDSHGMCRSFSDQSVAEDAALFLDVADFLGLS